MSTVVEALHDGITVAELDLSQPVFAVIGRETKVEVLLEAAGALTEGGVVNQVQNVARSIRTVDLTFRMLQVRGLATRNW